MFEYDELACAASEILDKHNFEDDILECRERGLSSVWEIRDYFEFENGMEVCCALDDLSNDEFMEYLTKRYGVQWKQVVAYHMIK